MAKLKGFWKAIITPEGGSAVTIIAQSGKPNPKDGQGTEEDWSLDQDAHVLRRNPDDIIKVGGSYEISEITETLPDVPPLVWGQVSGGYIGGKILVGTATMSFHTKDDAVGTPYWEHGPFKCQVEGDLEGAFEKKNTASLKIIQLKSDTAPTVEINGVAV